MVGNRRRNFLRQAPAVGQVDGLEHGVDVGQGPGGHGQAGHAQAHEDDGQGRVRGRRFA